ncbi:hypothetical protein ACFL2B_01065 [Patescibacteria group bacterium]
MFKTNKAIDVMKDVDELTPPEAPKSKFPDRIIGFDEAEHYAKLLAEIDFDPSAWVYAQIIEFCIDKTIPLFDRERVKEWLTFCRKKAGTDYWHWRPLRERDIVKEYHWGNSKGSKWQDGFYTSGTHYTEYGKEKEDFAWVCRPYDLPVPFLVLKTVKLIHEHFAERVKFFVSDYVNPAAESHYIMVRPTKPEPRNKDFDCIFAYWDNADSGIVI